MGRLDPGLIQSGVQAAPAIREERRRARRSKVTLRAHLQPYNPTAHIPEEIRPTLNVSRDGLYFTTNRSTYDVHLHLYVACPYSGPQSHREREVGRVVRVDSLPDGQWGVAVLFVRSMCFHRSPVSTAQTRSQTREAR
jgi:hypothetical protein